MSIKSMLPGLAFLAIAVVIFVFTDGSRRVYSGLFFVVIGVVSLVNARRGAAGAAEE